MECFTWFHAKPMKIIEFPMVLMKTHKSAQVHSKLSSATANNWILERHRNFSKLLKKLGLRVAFYYRTDN